MRTKNSAAWPQVFLTDLVGNRLGRIEPAIKLHLVAHPRRAVGKRTWPSTRSSFSPTPGYWSSVASGSVRRSATRVTPDEIRVMLVRRQVSPTVASPPPNLQICFGLDVKRRSLSRHAINRFADIDD